MLQEISTGRASRFRNVYVIGNFNYRKIDWDTLSGDQEVQQAEEGAPAIGVRVAGEGLTAMPRPCLGCFSKSLPKKSAFSTVI